MPVRLLILLLIVPVAACTRPGGPLPSLAPRPGETIDPRIPVETAEPATTADPALVARLEAQVTQARAGHAAFLEAAALAERRVAVAGAPQSESWVAAQQAISAAVAARRPTTLALGDIDEIAATLIAQEGWIAPADQAAIAAAAARVTELDRVQAARIDSFRARLGG